MTLPVASLRAQFPALAAAVAQLDTNAPAGTFTPPEAARWIGLAEGGLRIGLSAYNDDTDVDRLLDGRAGFLSSPPNAATPS